MRRQVRHSKNWLLIYPENMSKETIDRAIASGQSRSSGEGTNFVQYEAMLPGGLAIVMYLPLIWLLMSQNREAVTDNKARTAQKVKNAVSGVGGSLSKVLYQFSRKGIIVMHSAKDFVEILEDTINVGAKDVTDEDEGLVKVCICDAAVFSDSRYSLNQMMCPRRPTRSRTWATISWKLTQFGSHYRSHSWSVTWTANK